MGLRPGYKETDIGVIPEDWEVVEAIALNPFITSGSRGWAKYYSNRGELFLRITNLSRECIYPDISDRKLVDLPKNDTEGLRTVLADGDILISITADIGIIGYVNEAIPKPAYINQHISCLRLPVDKADGRFQSYFLASHDSQRRFAEMTDTGAKSGINLTTVGKLKLLSPPLLEQRAIAGALSDADALVASLDALISKKRDLKQATMQQLLTGKTRLPGFSGEWEVKRLGEIGEISGSGVDKKIREGQEPIRLVNYMDAYRRTWIRSSELDHFVTATPSQIRRCSVKAGDVFFTPSSETRDDIANSAVAVEDIPDAAYSYHVVRLRIVEPWDLKFRAYAFQTKSFLDQASMICDGGGTRYVISLGKFRSMVVRVPEAKEQAAIAEILSDMDAGLAILEAQRDKARALKQGMMQELLTGRIRLV